MVLPAILGVLAAGTGILGAIGGQQQQDQQRAAEQQRIDNQFQYDKKQYDFNWEQSLREYQYLLDQVGIGRAQEETVGRLKDQLSLDEYKYNLAIRDYEFQNQMKQYRESENIYNKQMSFNKMAAESAVAAENRRLRETVMSTAFENQDLVMELLQAEGMTAARGVAGKSTERQLNASMAAFGRNQAVMAESLVSAAFQTDQNMRNIDRELYGANIAAEANRMIMPTIRPDIPIPYKTPRAILMDPLMPKKGPEPIKGVNTSPQSNGLSLAGGIMGSLAAGVNAYNSAAPQGKKLFGN